MNLVKLTEVIVTGLVHDADSVSVKEFPSNNDDEIIIEVMVPSDEMGAVIGKDGKLAKALRTIVQASSYVNDNKLVKINIDSY